MTNASPSESDNRQTKTTNFSDQSANSKDANDTSQGFIQAENPLDRSLARSPPDSYPKRKERLSSREENDHKRQRTADSDDDDDNDEPTSQKRRPKQEARFGCPFYMNDPKKYSRVRICNGPGWTNTARVKEHIKRQHVRRLDCPTCKVTFKSEDEISAHERENEKCRFTSPQEGYVTKIQEERLKRRSTYKTSDMSEVDRWQEIYRIIFGDEGEIPSPFYESQYEDQKVSVDSVSEYLRHQMPSHRAWRLTEEGVLKQASRGRTTFDAVSESSPGESTQLHTESSGNRKYRIGVDLDLLSCPYRKRNPVRFNVRDHPTCSTQGYRDIASLKRHVKSFHKSRVKHHRYRCPRCKKSMPSQLGLEAHLMVKDPAEMCTPRIGPDHDTEYTVDPEDGFGDSTEKSLNERKNGTKVDTWVTLWKVLFQHDTDIQGSDFDPPIELQEVSHEIERNQDNLADRLEQVFRDAPDIKEQSKIALKAATSKAFNSFIKDVFIQCRNNVDMDEARSVHTRSRIRSDEHLEKNEAPRQHDSILNQVDLSKYVIMAPNPPGIVTPTSTQAGAISSHPCVSPPTYQTASTHPPLWSAEQHIPICTPEEETDQHMDAFGFAAGVFGPGVPLYSPVQALMNHNEFTTESIDYGVPTNLEDNNYRNSTTTSSAEISAGWDVLSHEATNYEASERQ